MANIIINTTPLLRKTTKSEMEPPRRMNMITQTMIIIDEILIDLTTENKVY